MLKTRIKRLALSGLSRLTGRSAHLLPAEAAGDGLLLDVSGPYRLEAPRLDLEILAPGTGRLAVEVLGYDGHFPTRRLWLAEGLPYSGPCRLSLDLAAGAVTLDDRPCGAVPPPLPARRFCCRLVLEQDAGARRIRLTSHYRAVTAEPAGGIGRGYFEGENYLDHEAQSVGEAADILGWLRRFEAEGPALEVGCATGNVLLALEQAGLPACGLDISEWAVEHANRRLGRERAWVCDAGAAAERGFPPEILARAPFHTLLLWSVFEHFRDPFATLEQLGRLAAPGATLLLQTTNADSLTHTIFGTDWEGYFDWTHLGVDQVSVRSIREGLPRLGWRIEHLHTHLLWTSSADPTHATLREGYAADSRFRRLLAERDLGDLILVVARKEGG
jgi:hypothetical protein